MRWSRELLESMENERGELPPGVIQSGWLGYPGATEAQIVCAEARLGTTLPPSYREFLKVTNGWRQTTPFISRLWSTEEIEWFPARHQRWINTFIDQFAEKLVEHQPINQTKNGSVIHLRMPVISDNDYFIYGADQDCMNLRLEYLQTALEISKKGDSSIYLLNPQIIATDGEWEAWFFGDLLPGADRYRSFQELMQAEYENFLELRDMC